MRILEYNDLDLRGLRSKYNKLLTALEKGDFYSAQIKKLQGFPYYSARLDDSNRVLLQLIKYHGQSYILILEIIHNHDYNKARFLNGAQVIEDKIIFDSPGAETKVVTDVAQINNINGIPDNSTNLAYLNDQQSKFYYLNKIISFDESQETIYQSALPLIIIGSAGSGKTMLALEKIKTLSGQILYVSLSNYLVNNSRNLYYAANYDNDDQEIDFLTVDEFIASINMPVGKAIDLNKFKEFFTRYKNNFRLNIDQVYEEFHGTLTGSDITKGYISKEDYLGLGVKQSLFPTAERELVYDLFLKYLDYLKKNHRYDPNIIAYENLNLVEAKYDYLVIDEVQDLTNIQIKLLFLSLKYPSSFILSGDSNQIIHPNFFSWAKIKTLLYQEEASNQSNSTQVNTNQANILSVLSSNYRNSRSIVDIANKVLKIKQKQFGSIDKESNYLVESVGEKLGKILLLNQKSPAIQKLNQNSRRSTKYAIIVLNDELKEEVRKLFANPLVFSIHEVKGLEYEHIILYNLVSCASKQFDDIADGLDPNDLEQDLVYARAKDKQDKSLEIYKFYINAFYVAVTRAIDELYIVEDRLEHQFLHLLGVTQYTENTQIEEQESNSSLDEWQQEASRLEKQGKLEQAQNIRSTILQEKTVPWQVMSEDKFIELYDQAIKPEAGKSDKLLIFEYALIYNRHKVIEQLRTQNLKATMHLENSMNVIRDKYYSEYTTRSIERVISLTRDYGLNFRNQFNQTPLMVASKVSNVNLVTKLIEQGANIEEIDNNGLTALQHLIADLIMKRKRANEDNCQIYQALSTNSIALKLDNQLIKLEPHRMEYFLFNLFLGCFINRSIAFMSSDYFIGFRAAELAKTVTLIPNGILSTQRKRREYISAILARNECNREGEYNKKLFLRLARGQYMYNPNLEIQCVDGEWRKLEKIIKTEFLLSKFI